MFSPLGEKETKQQRKQKRSGIRPIRPKELIGMVGTNNRTDCFVTDRMGNDIKQILSNN